jgi:hypothetical protein
MEREVMKKSKQNFILICMYKKIYEPFVKTNKIKIAGFVHRHQGLLDWIVCSCPRSIFAVRAFYCLGLNLSLGPFLRLQEVCLTSTAFNESTDSPTFSNFTIKKYRNPFVVKVNQLTTKFKSVFDSHTYSVCVYQI